ncbi:unnamed protein product [Cuscuta epithymum]|uniref:TFIIS N-terminal domain-containing protein n=1 Tax=Cuscuta epithymum TaxID=186058 RepID=A0AAV0CRH6_9ASTE|nr:unnamed protein product [Cuscuta epithymum]CAH9137797.1 unnamed protein product [Cuscuta epithymum]
MKTLEDLFALAEINNGLETPIRVKELIAIIQKEKDGDANRSIADATKQWSAVACTIAATNNEDCLQLFIHLDGLNFIDSWLKDAQKFSNDSIDDDDDDNNNNISFTIEESITDSLRAVEKLVHVCNGESASSGIRISVEKLLGHKSSKVQEMAKALIDKWKQGTVSVSMDVELVNLEEKGLSESSCGVVRHSDEGCNEHDRDNLLPSLRSEEASDKSLEYKIMQNGPSTYVNSPSPTMQNGDLRNEEESTKLMHPEHGPLNEQGKNNSNDCLKGKQKTGSSETLDDTVFSSDDETKDAMGKESEYGNHCRSTTPLVIEANESSKRSNFGREESDEEDHSGDESDGDLPFGQFYMGNKDAADMIGIKKSNDHDLGCCSIMDPLEVALQVAMEVGREFEHSSVKKTATVHHEEPTNSIPTSDSESEKHCETSTTTTTDSPSNKGEEAQKLIICPPICDNDASPSTSDSESEKHCETSTTTTTDSPSNKGEEAQKLIICPPICDNDASRAVGGGHVNISAVDKTQDLVDSSLVTIGVKGSCDFDLNQEVFTEKDTAEQQHSNCRLDIDLNMCDEDAAVGGEAKRCLDLNTRDEEDNNMAAAGEESSSVDEAASVSKMPPRGVDVDLNCVTEEAHPTDWMGMERRLLSKYPNSPHQSQSRPSSSSSFLNIDLNDNRGFLHDYSSNHLSNFTNPSLHAVSIMGMKVDLNKKESLVPGLPIMPLGPVHNSAEGMESLFAYPRPATGYKNNYNRITAPGHAYGSVGPVPCMVDFRKVPVTPRMVGPTSYMTPVFPQLQPYGQPIMTPQSGFDLNDSGLMISPPPPPDARELNRQYLDPLLQPISQPSTSLTVGEKRREPEGGWEPYPCNFFNRH